MRRLLLSVLASGMITACGGVTPDPDPDPEPSLCDDDSNMECPTTPTVVTTAAVQEIFAVECSECHEANCTTPNCGDLELWSEALTQETVGRSSRYAVGTPLKIVDPGNLRNSTMWLKLLGGTNPGGCTAPDGKNVFEEMPNDDEGPLTQAQLDTVKNWICSGGGAG